MATKKKTATKKTTKTTEPTAAQQQRHADYLSDLRKRAAKVDVHMPPAFGARPLFRMRLVKPDTVLGYLLIDVLSITAIPNFNRAYEKSFARSKAEQRFGAQMKHHSDETWHCLCYSDSGTEPRWDFMSIGDIELCCDVHECYEVVS
jgi:hypothetical protein